MLSFSLLVSIYPIRYLPALIVRLFQLDRTINVFSTFFSSTPYICLYQRLYQFKYSDVLLQLCTSSDALITISNFLRFFNCFLRCWKMWIQFRDCFSLPIINFFQHKRLICPALFIQITASELYSCFNANIPALSAVFVFKQKRFSFLQAKAESKKAVFWPQKNQISWKIYKKLNNLKNPKKILCV